MYIPGILIEAMKNGNVVVFIGSGLSSEAGASSWVELLNNIIKIKESNTACNRIVEINAARNAINNGRLINAATILADVMGPVALKEAIAREFGNPEVVHTYTQELIFQLGIKAVITTNYDLLLEQAAPPGTTTYSWKEKALTNAIQKKKPFIFHLHGDIDHPADIVICWNDYNSILSSISMLNSLHGLLTSSVLLWIGYSHTDPDLHLLMAEHRTLGISGGYQLMKRDDYELASLARSRNIEPVLINSYDEIRNFLKALMSYVPYTLVLTKAELNNLAKAVTQYFKEKIPRRIMAEKMAPPTIRFNEEGKPCEKILTELEEFFPRWYAHTLKENKKPVALVAPHGVGKTLLLTRFVYWLYDICNSTDNPEQLPVVFFLTTSDMLGSFSEGNFDFSSELLKLIAPVLAGNKIWEYRDLLKKICKEERVVLIFDGLDEFGARRRGLLDALLKALHAFSQEKHVQVFLSCRKIFWEEQVKEKEKWDRFDILPLTPEAVEQIIAPHSLGDFAYDMQNKLKSGVLNHLIVNFILDLNKQPGGLPRFTSRFHLYRCWIELLTFWNNDKTQIGKEEWIALYKQTAYELITKLAFSIEPPVPPGGHEIPVVVWLATDLFYSDTVQVNENKKITKIRFFHETISEFFTAWMLEDSFQKVLFDDFRGTSFQYFPLMNVCLDFLQPSVYGFLFDILGAEYLPRLMHKLKKSDLPQWNIPLLRNLIEYVGMVYTPDAGYREVGEVLLLIIKNNKIDNLVRYNAARALERIHFQAPQPYFDYMSDWGDRDWKAERQIEKELHIKAWAIRGYRGKGQEKMDRKPGDFPWLCVLNKKPIKTDIQLHVSGELGSIIKDLLGEIIANIWLIINCTFAWIRWLHPKHQEMRNDIEKLFTRIIETVSIDSLDCRAVSENLQWIVKMMFPFKWVPEEPYRQYPVQLFVLEMNPETIQPDVSVQPHWNRCLGIIRGEKEGGVLIEDHIREKIDAGGVVAETEGECIFGASAMRDQVWTEEQHITNYSSRHPGQALVGWAGNGNLLCNRCFVAYSDAERRLYHLRSEERNFIERSYSYTCLVVRRLGFEPRVSIEHLYFGYEGSNARVYALDGKDITDSVVCVTSGQRLVEDGAALTTEEIIIQALRNQYYDLRHLFLFGRIGTGEHRWMDAGLAAFWDCGVINKVLLEKALRGGAVTMDCTQFPETEIHAALANKGYRSVLGPATPGEYNIERGELTIVFREGIYPHSMIGIRQDGRVLLTAIKGLSNRAGVTVQGAAQIMQSLGAQQALLIDNGGDVMLNFRSKAVFESAEGRDRWRSLILFKTNKPFAELSATDINLIKYPGIGMKDDD